MLPVTQPNGQGNVLSPQVNTMGGVGGPSASPPGGTPKQRSQPRPPSTFAGMQQQGMARPSRRMVQPQGQPQGQPGQAPGGAYASGNPALQGAVNAMQAQPTMQSSMQAARSTVDNAAAGRNLGMFGYGATVNQIGAPLMQQVMTLLNDPTQGLNEAAQSNFDRLNRTIGREFSDLRGNLNENMAARGLDASTIAATKLGELGARQAEAQGDLAARIQEQLIRDRAGAMNNAINAAMGLRGQEMDMEQSLFTINRDTGQLEFDRGMAQRRLGLDEELGRGNLQLGRDRLGLDTEIGRGNLALGRERLGFDRERDTRDFDYRVGRDAVDDRFRTDEFDWRRSTDQRDFDWRRDTDQRDFGYRQGRDQIGDQRWQSQFDRDGQWRQEDVGYRRDRDEVGDRRWTDTFNRDNDWRQEDNRYRDTRDGVNDGRWQQTFDQNQNNFNTTGMLSLLQGMGFNNISPAMLSSIYRALGVPQSAGGGTGAGGAANGGGGGTYWGQGGGGNSDWRVQYAL